MIRTTKSLLDIAQEYDDTQELANALLEIAKDEAISPPSTYFLKEAATHMTALYSSYLETVRALRSSSSPISHHSYAIDPSTNFSQIEAWHFEDYLYLLHLAHNVYRQTTAGGTRRILVKEFKVAKNISVRLGSDLNDRYSPQLNEYMCKHVASLFGAAA
ncbi:MAG: hypothetical protein QE265_04875 [Rhodoferax sp.]|nr:hypothetical protein [Rhodoferax sp.]